MFQSHKCVPVLASLIVAISPGNFQQGKNSLAKNSSWFPKHLLGAAAEIGLSEQWRVLLFSQKPVSSSARPTIFPRCWAVLGWTRRAQRWRTFIAYYPASWGMQFAAATARDRSPCYTEPPSLLLFFSNLSLETECENTFSCLQVFFLTSSADLLLVHLTLRVQGRRHSAFQVMLCWNSCMMEARNMHYQ